MVNSIDKQVFFYHNRSRALMKKSYFEWDACKNVSNQEKHGVGFVEAQFAFLDPKRVIVEDIAHSNNREKRYYCFGKVSAGIMTVRFTYRNRAIRIIGAGFWRKGKKIYEEKNGSIHE